MVGVMTYLKKEDNWTFHCCKVMWLVKARERLVCILQCRHNYQNDNYSFAALGTARGVFAIMQLDLWDKHVVVWDRENVITNQKSLSFDEWYNIFDVANQSKFAVNVEGRIMEEIHVGERRDLIIDAEVNIKTFIPNTRHHWTGKALTSNIVSLETMVCC